MKITGHKSESQFMKYIKVTGEQNARLLLEHPHFSGRAADAVATTAPAMVRQLHKVA